MADPTAATHAFPTEFDIFNMSLDRNPLVEGKWATVVKNYCTGDIHVVDSSPELTSSDVLDTVTLFHNVHNKHYSILSTLFGAFVIFLPYFYSINIYDIQWAEKTWSL